jgi:hypothetical protein
MHRDMSGRLFTRMPGEVISGWWDFYFLFPAFKYWFDFFFFIMRMDHVFQSEQIIKQFSFWNSDKFQ